MKKDSAKSLPSYMWF